jgi:hypothetical protein
MYNIHHPLNAVHIVMSVVVVVLVVIVLSVLSQGVHATHTMGTTARSGLMPTIVVVLSNASSPTDALCVRLRVMLLMSQLNVSTSLGSKMRFSAVIDM